jgi:predicted DNA-binding transcriptional regulator AlpA
VNINNLTFKGNLTRMKSLQNRIIIRPSEIQDLYGLSRTTVHRQINANAFPGPFNISKGCKGWFKEDLDKHFKNLSKAKNDKKFKLPSNDDES